MAEKIQGFKRINFFRGFLTTEDDWNAAEAYHVEKRKLHNRMLHGPGIVPDAWEGFKVRARGKGGAAIEISPGYAIDGQGHDIILTEPMVIGVNPADYENLPTTLYIVAKYVESYDDFIAYKQNPDYKGHRRIAERAKVDIQAREPDIHEEIELARILLSKDARRIVEPRESGDPRQNEIDRRFLPIAGIIGSTIPARMLHDLHRISALTKRTFKILAHEKGVESAGSVLHAFVTLDMLLQTNLIDRRNFFEIMRGILTLETDVVREIEKRVPEMSKQREFYNFKDAIRRSLGELGEADVDLEFIGRLMKYQEKSCDAFGPLFEGLIVDDRPEVEEARITPEVVEQLLVWSKEVTESFQIDKVTLKLRDMIDVLDEQSEASHKFKIVDEKDKYRTRQTLKYPDETEVQDSGVGYEGGYCEFELHGLTPHRDVALMMRTDVVHGDWKADVIVNGEKIGTWECSIEDRKYRWRNLTFVIDAKHVNDTRLFIRQVPVTADRDINMFRLWAVQPDEK